MVLAIRTAARAAFHSRAAGLGKSSIRPLQPRTPSSSQGLEDHDWLLGCSVLGDDGVSGACVAYGHGPAWLPCIVTSGGRSSRGGCAWRAGAASRVWHSMGGELPPVSRQQKLPVRQLQRQCTEQSEGSERPSRTCRASGGAATADRQGKDANLPDAITPSRSSPAAGCFLNRHVGTRYKLSITGPSVADPRASRVRRNH